MNADLGNYSLMAALLACALTMVASLGAVRFGTPGWHSAVRWGFYAFTGLLLIASAALTNALAQSDFALTYVAGYTERALPMGYKLSAFWAGQEGSLLFWGVTLALMAAIFVFAQRKTLTRSHAFALLTLAGVCGFFVAMLLLAANPFKLNPVIPADGHGLNPMLQNIGMIAHPPTLFIGYAGFTIPFALVIGALLAGRIDNTWIVAARRWALVSWVFLTVGIVLGAQWAYVELGWGGYWAWDPVENASLLPWLTGTALLHAMVVQKDRSMFKVWSSSMAILTFILCIFGTYITRSGIIQSVHAFAPSLIATFFLWFLLIVTGASLLILITRWRHMKQDTLFEAFVSKEGAILVGNCMLVLMMLLTLLGTMYPVISGLFTDHGISVNQNFYNKTVLPLAILMLLMMGAAPLLNYGSTGRIRETLKRLRIPLIVAHLAMFTVIFVVDRSLWTSFATFAIALTVTGIITDFVSVVMSRRRNGDRGVIRPALAVLNANHRRYGGHMAHLGMAMMVAGVLGSSLYVTKMSVSLKEGESTTVGTYDIKLVALENVEGGNFSGVEALVDVTDSSGRVFKMTPQIRKYFKSENSNAEVAFLTGLREDVYVSVLGIEPPNAAALQVWVNPLVLWIWIGGIAMTVGGLWCMLPIFGAKRREAQQEEAQNKQEVLA